MKRQSRPTLLARPLDYVLCGVFVLLWLVPVTYSGFAYEPVRFFPDYLRYLDRVACLFHKSQRISSNFYIQLQLQNQKSWVTPPEDLFSTMRPSGHRTRIGWAVARSIADARGELQRQRIAEFVRQRYEDSNPERPRVAAVRFLHILYKIGEPQLAHPSGAWSQPPLEVVAPGRGYVVSEHTFEPPAGPGG